MKKEVAQATAKWWRNEIEGRYLNESYGKQNLTDGFLGNTLIKNVPTVEQLDAFEANLVNAIINSDVSEIILERSIMPCQMLYNAATEAGVDICVFSWQAHTKTTETEVYASNSYKAPFERIYAYETENT